MKPWLSTFSATLCAVLLGGLCLYGYHRALTAYHAKVSDKLSRIEQGLTESRKLRSVLGSGPAVAADIEPDALKKATGHLEWLKMQTVTISLLHRAAPPMASTDALDWTSQKLSTERDELAQAIAQFAGERSK